MALLSPFLAEFWSLPSLKGICVVCCKCFCMLVSLNREHMWVYFPMKMVTMQPEE